MHEMCIDHISIEPLVQERQRVMRMESHRVSIQSTDEQIDPQRHMIEHIVMSQDLHQEV